MPEGVHAEFPLSILKKDLHINALELLGLMVAVKVWGVRWQGKRIRILCDNSASVSVLNSGRCKDPFMLATLREIQFVAANGGFEVRAQHIAGVDNRLPDMLSRWNIDPKLRSSFLSINRELGLRERTIPVKTFKFSHPW